MGALDRVREMKAAAQANVDALATLEGEIQVLVEQPQVGGLPVDDTELKGQLEKAKGDLEKMVAERDALRAAIEAEIEDKKTDTKRLEAAVAPIEVAPVPVIPEAPAPVETAPVGAEPRAEVPVESVKNVEVE